MRINAQLIDAETGGHVWAERFDGQWADVFALQDKVVGSIAGALKLRLVSGQGKADIAGGTSNPAAYDAYLRGMEIYLRDNTPEEFAQAVTYFQQALALDPDFGAAMRQPCLGLLGRGRPARQGLGPFMGRGRYQDVRIP